MNYLVPLLLSTTLIVLLSATLTNVLFDKFLINSFILMFYPSGIENDDYS